MQAYPFFRTTIVEAVIPASTASGTFIPWQKNDLLNKAIIMGLIAFDVNQLKRTPKNQVVVPDLLGLSAVVIQRLPSKKVLDTYPMYSLSDSYNGGIIKEFAPFDASNTESGFLVNDGTTYAGESAVLLVNYVNDLAEYKKAMAFIKNIYGENPYVR